MAAGIPHTAGGSWPGGVAEAQAAAAPQVVMDLGGLECAAGQWLGRLKCEGRLPSKGVLETLRRRELERRERAEGWAEAEHQSRAFLKETLENERRLHAQRAAEFEEARATALAEQKLRLEAESALAAAERARRAAEAGREAEEAQRLAEARRRETLERDVVELRALVDDDQSLRALDDLTSKLEVQRGEIATLREVLEVREVELVNTHKCLQQSQQLFLRSKELWVKQQAQLTGERDEARGELSHLRQFCANLQHTSEAALAICSQLYADVEKRDREGRERDQQQAALQTAAEGLLGALGPLASLPPGPAPAAATMHRWAGGSVSWPSPAPSAGTAAAQPPVAGAGTVPAACGEPALGSECPLQAPASPSFGGCRELRLGTSAVYPEGGGLAAVLCAAMEEEEEASPPPPQAPSSPSFGSSGAIARADESVASAG